jgi:hypothetical protein
MVSALVVLAGSFAFTWALMWGLQRTGAFANPAVQAATAGQLGALRSPGPPKGPDDDLAFLQELPRLIDRDQFRP